MTTRRGPIWSRAGIRPLTTWVVATIALAGTWACAGDGTGVGEFEDPPGQTELAPTLSSIQASVFTPLCAGCHTGSAGPLGLALDEGVAWNNLVNVQSAQLPGMERVAPGEAEYSYLVWKVEGRSEIVGSQMPRGLPVLSPAQMAAIREWIDSGAPNN